MTVGLRRRINLMSAQRQLIGFAQVPLPGLLVCTVISLRVTLCVCACARYFFLWRALAPSPREYM